MFFLEHISLTRESDSQGYSQARPQLAESFLGTGTIFAGMPSFLQVRSKSTAMLVMSNMARQRNEILPFHGVYWPRIRRPGS